MAPEISPSKYAVECSWSDVPHLDAKMKAEILADTLPHLRDARTKGIPSLGAGAIYPIPLDEVLVDPFAVPAYWPRAYALDVGWNRTAALWAAHDRSVDCVYLYSEYYRGQAEPPIHAAAIKARGEWIPGVVDPAAAGSTILDGTQVLLLYQAYGLDLAPALNAIDAGIWAVWSRLSTGRLKVFRTLQNFQAEYRIYRRDEDGKIVKAFDHLMDCARYLCMSGLDRAKVKPVPRFGVDTGIADEAVGY